MNIRPRLKHRDTFPVWVWPEKPDLNSEALLNKGDRGVCLTVEIPDSLVLLSDFQAWHCVLNEDYLPYSDAEDDDYEAGRPTVVTRYQSWDRVFKLQNLRKSELWGPELDLQGTVSKIYLDQVKKVEYFTAN